MSTNDFTQLADSLKDVTNVSLQVFRRPAVDITQYANTVLSVQRSVRALQNLLRAPATEVIVTDAREDLWERNAGQICSDDEFDEEEVVQQYGPTRNVPAGDQPQQPEAKRALGSGEAELLAPRQQQGVPERGPARLPRLAQDANIIELCRLYRRDENAVPTNYQCCHDPLCGHRKCLRCLGQQISWFDTL